MERKHESDRMKFAASLMFNKWIRFVLIGIYRITSFSVILLLFCIMVQMIYGTFNLSGIWNIAKTFIIGIPIFIYVYVVTGKPIILCLERQPLNLSHHGFSSREKINFGLSIITLLCWGVLAMVTLFKYSPTEDLARLMFFICPIAWSLFGGAAFCSQILSRK